MEGEPPHRAFAYLSREADELTLQVATKAIVASASYGPGPKGFATSFLLPRGAEEVSGVDQMLWAVRDQVGHGPDWVKPYADYRRGPNGSNVPTLNLAEIQAAVDEAKNAGRPVAVHASHPEGMRRAAVAGAQAIEHGYFGTDEVFKAMAAKSVAFYPTLAAQEASAIYNQVQTGRLDAATVPGAGKARVPVGPQAQREHRPRKRRRGIERTAQRFAAANHVGLREILEHADQARDEVEERDGRNHGNGDVPETLEPIGSVEFGGFDQADWHILQARKINDDGAATMPHMPSRMRAGFDQFGSAI